MSWLRGLIAAGVRNPVYANVLMICILAGGVLAGTALVRETYPEFSLDRLAVEVAYPGASPEQVEEGVCVKIEQALEGVPGVRKVWSRAEENAALVIVELRSDAADPRLVLLDVKDRVDRIDTFPPEVEAPVVREVIARAQVINVSIYGDAPERAIKEWAQEIKNELLGLGAVSQVKLRGVRDYEISIQVSEEALSQYGLTMEQVAGVVARNCLDLAAGSLRTQREELLLRTTGQRYTGQQFEDLVVIAHPDGTLIRLGQIATIADGFEDDYKLARFDGKPAAVLEVFKTADQDTSTIAAAVRQYVAAKKPELPAPLHIVAWADNSRQVDARIDMLLVNAMLGMVLVIVVLTLFLDFRVSLYVAVGIPVSFAGALIVMHVTGETLNMITLFGLIMVIGIVVDDAIVVSDGFRHRVRAGDEPALAAINGANHVALPVLASSLTTIIAFLPLLFVVGIMGKFIAVLPVVVIAAIVFSSIEVFCVLPSHLRHCLHGNGGDGRLTRRARSVQVWVDGFVDRVIDRAYRPSLKAALNARGLALAACAAVLVVVIGLVAGDRIPFTLLPEMDSDTLRARIRFPQGVPAERTEAAVGQLEAAALRLNRPDVLAHRGSGDLVANTFAIVGQRSGWVDEHGSHLGELIVELLPAEQRRADCKQIMAAWSQQIGSVQGASALTLDRVQQGPTDKPLELRLLGDDLDALSMAADDVAAALGGYAGVSGVEHDLRPGKREVRVRLKPLARTLGVTLEDVARQLRSGFYGGEAVRVRRGRDEVRVQVRYPDRQRMSIGDIETLRVRAPDGRELPFRELADCTVERGYGSVQRQQGHRRVRIMADVDERLANAERILTEFRAGPLPRILARYPGIDYRIQGQHGQMVESLRSLFSGLAVALIAIYGVLAAMLGSYGQPLIIMAVIPLGFIGAAAGHAVTGYDLTIMSVFGLVALAGVVVNDSLVLLDQINRNVAAGQPITEAIIDAGAMRFRAVILTTVTTVAGLAPLLLERSTQAQSLKPMAISLTFGLAFATVLTLIVVPVLYLVSGDVRRLAIRLIRPEPARTVKEPEALHHSS